MSLIFKDNMNYFRYHKKSYHVEPMDDVVNSATKYVYDLFKAKGNKFSPHTLFAKFLVDVLGAEYSTIPHKDLETLINHVKNLLPNSVAKKWYNGDKEAFDDMQIIKSSGDYITAPFDGNKRLKLASKSPKKYLRAIGVKNTKNNLKTLKNAVVINKNTRRSKTPIVF